MSWCPLLPHLAVPVLRTPRLRDATAFYVDTLGFTLAQKVPGVLALLRHGPLVLQLWQAQTRAPQGCCIRIDADLDSIFDCHARLARHARTRIAAPPALQPWGAWEFSLVDGEDNRLVFVQWAATLPARMGAGKPLDREPRTP